MHSIIAWGGILIALIMVGKECQKCRRERDELWTKVIALQKQLAQRRMGEACE